MIGAINHKRANRSLIARRLLSWSLVTCKSPDSHRILFRDSRIRTQREELRLHLSDWSHFACCHQYNSVNLLSRWLIFLFSFVPFVKNAFFIPILWKKISIVTQVGMFPYNFLVLIVLRILNGGQGHRSTSLKTHQMHNPTTFLDTLCTFNTLSNYNSKTKTKTHKQDSFQLRRLVRRWPRTISSSSCAIMYKTIH